MDEQQTTLTPIETMAAGDQAEQVVTTDVGAEEVRPRNNRGEESEIFVEDFDYDGFEVVRREFFAHVFEPAITLKYDCIQANTACIKKWPEVDFVQVLINQEQHRLVLKPCTEDAKDAVRWVAATGGKRKTRAVKGRIFCAKLFDMLHWDINCRYKFLGIHVSTSDEKLMVFNLADTEVYKPIDRNPDGTAKKMGRKPYYPEAWKDSFGVPVAQHDDQLQINILEGFARYEVVQKPKPVTEVVPTGSMEGITVETVTQEGPEAAGVSQVVTGEDNNG